jgi:hypothetical protein
MKLEMILTTDAGDTARIEVEDGKILVSAHAKLDQHAMSTFQSMWHFAQGLSRGTLSAFPRSATEVAAVWKEIVDNVGAGPRPMEKIRKEVDKQIDDFAAQGSPMAQHAQRMRTRDEPGEV